MPNGHERKKYGGHDYGDHDGTCDCKFGCGCWAGPARSGGPLGLDPFGKCPNNPEDGQRRQGKIDYEDVVEQRISDFRGRAYQAEAKLEKVSPSKKALAADLAVTKRELAEANQKLKQIMEIATK